MSASIQDLDKILNYFNKDRQVPVKTRGNDVLQQSLVKLSELSRSRGLSPEDITSLVNTVCHSSSFGIAVKSKIINCLIPNSVVPEDAIVSALSWICTTEPSASVRIQVLRWVIAVFDEIESKQKLHSLYGVVFYFLNTEYLLPHACYLLCQLTKQQDVWLMRIRHLINLYKSGGKETHISSLLSIYKCYRPEHVVIPLSGGKRFATRPYFLWKNYIDILQSNERNAMCSNPTYFIQHTFWREEETSRKKHVLKGNKRMKLDSQIPTLEVMPETELCLKSKRSNGVNAEISLKSIQNFNELLEKLDVVQFPQRSSLVLNYPILQHLMSCRKSKVFLLRLQFWLNGILIDEMLNKSNENDMESTIAKFILENACCLSQYIQESIPVIEHIVLQYLKINWDEKSYLPFILTVISNLRMKSWNEMFEFLAPIRTLFCKSSTYIKIAILEALQELVINLIRTEFISYSMFQNELSFEAWLSSSSRKEFQHLYLFEDIENTMEDFSWVQTVYELLNFVDELCIFAVDKGIQHAYLNYVILRFYEKISHLISEYKIPFLHILPQAIFYRLFFGENALIVSRLCNLLLSYKATINQLKQYMNLNIMNSLSKFGVTPLVQLIREVNGYISHVVDGLWRERAFGYHSAEGIYAIDGLDVKAKEVRDLNRRWSLISHPALIVYSLEYIEQNFPDLKCQLIDIRTQHRSVALSYLKFLKCHELAEISTFMESFLRIE